MSPQQDSNVRRDAPRRYRNVSGIPLNRRVVMKAAAGLSATLMGATAIAPRSGPASAQEVDGTRAREWIAADNVGVNATVDGDGWVTFETEFPFWAVGIGWSGDVGWWPAVDIQVSADGETWGDEVTMVGRDDGGPAPTDGRIYTDLFFTDGEQFIRYRPRDGEGNLVELDGLLINYIDPTDGPWDADRAETVMRTTAVGSSVNTDTDVPPTIITRAQWGANESLRFEGGQEIWPSEYQTVQHAIVHHAAVNYGSDGYNAVRSIYYYHCVTQGWGDIGYNYVVDVNGNIFEGRVGGANVIGGHAYEYANGSSGICVMGDFSYADAPAAAKAALAHILAYVTRDLDTYARRPFHQVPNLPTICGHRDVVQSTCPGNGLYDDLPYLRDTVAATLDAGNLDSGNPGGIVPGDRVKVVTEDGGPLNMRSGAGLDKPVNGGIPNGTRLRIEQGPISTAADNWYRVTHGGRTGWVSADFLLVDPPLEDPTGAFTFGVNVRVRGSSYLRNRPSTSGSIVATVPNGSWGFVMAGPQTANGYTWYQLRTQSHGDGWMATTGFELAPVYNPTGKFSPGQTVVATTSAPLRVRPGIAQTASGTASSGVSMVVSVAPIAVTDRIWYGVHSGATGGGWVEEGHLRAGASGTPAGPVTAVGQQFRVTEALNMRTGAGTNFGVVATLPAGTTGSVIGGPSSASGYTWWQVRTSGGSTGWVVTNWIERLSSSTPQNPTGFEKGVGVRTSIAVNLRRDAGTNNPIVATLSSNTNGTITDGPRVATGFTWWKLRTAAGQEGWAVQDYLVRTSGPGEPPPNVFDIGDGFRVTAAVNSISAPEAGHTVLERLAKGEYGAILDGPVNYNGRIWYRTRIASRVGWSPQDWLERADEFGVGDGFRVTAAVNSISAPEAGHTVLERLAKGEYGAILDGPVNYNGRIWYRTRIASRVGWSPQDWLERADEFGVGDGFRVTAAVNSISAPEAGHTVLMRLPTGLIGQIVDGPVYYNGRIWYQTSSSWGEGWSPQDWLQNQ